MASQAVNTSSFSVGPSPGSASASRPGKGAFRVLSVLLLLLLLLSLQLPVCFNSLDWRALFPVGGTVCSHQVLPSVGAKGNVNKKKKRINCAPQEKFSLVCASLQAVKVCSCSFSFALQQVGGGTERPAERSLQSGRCLQTQRFTVKKKYPPKTPVFKSAVLWKASARQQRRSSI